MLAATCATLTLVGAIALANFADKGLLHFCVDPSWGGVRLLVGGDTCTANETPFDIQQPYAYATSRETEPTFVTAPSGQLAEADEQTILELKVPAGSYKIEAKTNLVITNIDPDSRPDEVEAYLSECDLIYYQNTDSNEFSLDVSTETVAPKYGDDKARAVHNLIAVLTVTAPTTIGLECDVAATRGSVLDPETKWSATNSKIIADVLADLSNDPH
ncbi:MAG: hypothetical protein E6J09_11445 [Chloroflexi bacterium]|nr:MAG: hypothetical protein E6J09_11445 [Chloroflexota bacterium]